MGPASASSPTCLPPFPPPLLPQPGTFFSSVIIRRGDHTLLVRLPGGRQLRRCGISWRGSGIINVGDGCGACAAACMARGVGRCRLFTAWLANTAYFYASVPNCGLSLQALNNGSVTRPLVSISPPSPPLPPRCQVPSGVGAGSTGTQHTPAPPHGVAGRGRLHSDKPAGP